MAGFSPRTFVHCLSENRVSMHSLSRRKAPHRRCSELALKIYNDIHTHVCLVQSHMVIVFYGMVFRSIPREKFFSRSSYKTLTSVAQSALKT